MNVPQHASFNVPQDQPTKNISPKMFVGIMMVAVFAIILLSAVMNHGDTSSTTSSAPVVPALTQDQQYLSQLASIGIVPSSSDQGLIVVGHQICQEQQLGLPVPLSVGEFRGNNNVSLTEAQGAVAIAIQVYCPQFGSANY